MKLFKLTASIVVARDRDDVFKYFDNPRNLEAMTPPGLSFRILTPGEIEMATGACIDYVVTVSGLPMRWTSLIQGYDPPNRFVDIQLRGPYSFWHHEHRFESVASGTKVIDEVCYALPFGVLGRVAHRLGVARQLRAIFKFRHQVLVDTLDGIAESASLSIE